MRAPWLALLAVALFAALPRGVWSQARTPERPLPLPLPPPPTPAPPPALAPAPFQPAPFGRPLAPAGTAPPQATPVVMPVTPAAPPGRWVAIYAAVAPASAHGISPLLGDRIMAHVRAETLCRGQPGGESCRLALELREGCGVLVQAVRDQRPVRLGTPPAESLARLPTAFSLAVQGPDMASAEREAMTRCQARERSLLCRVVASACAAPR